MAARFLFQLFRQGSGQILQGLDYAQRSARPQHFAVPASRVRASSPDRDGKVLLPLGDVPVPVGAPARWHRASRARALPAKPGRSQERSPICAKKRPAAPRQLGLLPLAASPGRPRHKEAPPPRAGREGAAAARKTLPETNRRRSCPRTPGKMRGSANGRSGSEALPQP